MLNLLLTSAVIASPLNKPNASWQIQPQLEVGFIAPLQNDIQLGKSGTDFDYIKQGGADNLFRYQRFEINWEKDQKHNFSFLFQPFDITTTETSTKELRFDNTSFPKDSPMFFRYGFDYYRATYSYNFVQEKGKRLSAGVAMQIRNATIDFRSQDGSLQNSNRDIGPVPLLHTSGEFDYSKQQWWGFDLTGSYAPIKYINGSNVDVVGALIDTSLRGGVHLKNDTDMFLNLRYIAGGAEGTDNTPDPGKDGWVSNWLQLASLSVGIRLR